MRWQLVLSAINLHLRPYHSPGNHFSVMVVRDWNTVRILLFIRYISVLWHFSATGLWKLRFTLGHQRRTLRRILRWGNFPWLKAFCTGLSTFYCSITNLSMLSGCVSPSYGASSACTRNRRSPDTDESWEHVDWRVADSRQGVVHHNRDTASITNHSMLSGYLSRRHGKSSACIWNMRSPDTDDSWEYVEWRVADSRQGVVHHSRGAARN